MDESEIYQKCVGPEFNSGNTWNALGSLFQGGNGDIRGDSLLYGQFGGNGGGAGFWGGFGGGGRTNADNGLSRGEGKCGTGGSAYIHPDLVQYS